MWHIHGYDKLKPFEFCIQGAIDGYSRRIIWLEVSQSNNNPAIIAMYYLEALKVLGVAHRILRSETEPKTQRCHYLSRSSDTMIQTELPVLIVLSTGEIFLILVGNIETSRNTMVDLLF